MTQSREWNAAAYHLLSNAQFEWGRKVLARVRVRGDETVLDVGCGTGRLTAELLKLLPRGRVIASDLSENMLRTARSTMQPFQGQVRFVCADLQQLPFLHSLDGIFSTASFHWVQDHERMLRELFTALKPGGWLVAQCGGGQNLARLRQNVAALIASPRYARFFQGWREPWNFASPELMAQRMRNAGFIDVNTWLESGGFSLPDSATFKQYLATVTLHRHLARMDDPRLQEEFLDDLAGQYREPEYHLDYWRLNMDGRRSG
ncbi:MAG: trans-aconitate 2-methyltransferase [Terriglobales bacterium]